MTQSNRILAVLSILFAVAATGSAQNCFFGDDGFDTGCCNVPAPHLPPFPAITVSANYGIIEGCGPSFASVTNVQFSAPSFVTCDIALINVFATLSGGQTISGMLVAKYTRTWMDNNPVLFDQVWRFLVNGDLSCVDPGATLCTTILPRCSALVPGVPIHWDGHIDYICDPLTSGGFRAAFSLNHMQGCISHAPWSCVPIGLPADHIDSSYHLVGPMPFTFGTSFAVPQGLVLADSIRSAFIRFFPFFQYACKSETKVPNVVGAGFLTTTSDAATLCAVFNGCTFNPIFSTFPGCYQNQSLTGVGCCNGNTSGFASVPIPGTPIAPTGLVAFKVGSWGPATFNLYPSFGDLTTYFGVVSHLDSCAVANSTIHAVVGVGIQNVFGQLFNTSSPPLCGPPLGYAGTFMDLQNVLPLNTLPFLSPGYGCLAVPDIVWSLNL